jgi:glycosyltransferase involved in cell wall biosynthesis
VQGIYNADARALIADWIGQHDTGDTVYHLHNWHKYLSPSAFAALRGVSQRLIMSAHDYFLVCPNGGYYHYPVQKICGLTPLGAQCLLASCDKRHYAHKLWRVARHAMRASLFSLRDTPATIVAVHEAMIPYLERGGVSRSSIRIVRNPVTPWCSERVPAERNRDIFFVGRVEVDKGVDVLARVARKIGARLQIAGDGPLMQELRSKNPEAVMLGRLARNELAHVMTKARILVVPTRWPETFGLVAVEGLMSGIPVIASDSVPFAGDIVSGGFGRTYYASDEEALAKEIASLMHDDAIVLRMSQRGFLEGRKLAPTPDEWCENLLALYEEKIAAAHDRGAVAQAAG